MRQEVAHWAKEQMRQQLTGQTSAAAPVEVGLSLAHVYTVRKTLHLINYTLQSDLKTRLAGNPFI